MNYHSTTPEPGLKTIPWLRFEPFDCYGELVSLAEFYGFTDDLDYEDWNPAAADALEMDCIEHLHRCGVFAEEEVWDE